MLGSRVDAATCSAVSPIYRVLNSSKSSPAPPSSRNLIGQVHVGAVLEEEGYDLIVFWLRPDGLAGTHEGSKP